jgi:hypothetical protein
MATAIQHRLVTVCNELAYARSGCAVSYANDNSDRLRRGQLW